MSCQSAVYQWTEVVTTHMPHLSKPQAAGLALWSVGMVLARSCALSAVSEFVAKGLERKPNTVRQQMREWCYEAQAKRGGPRQEVKVETCFAPLLAWVLDWWEGTQLALAVDATTLGQRFVVLVVSVVYRGCAIPVAWTVLSATEKHAWRREWLRMLRQVRTVVPRRVFVIVLADRGLYARWLFQRIVRLGWHPLLRINTGGTFRPAKSTHYRALRELVPQPGTQWVGEGTAFQGPRRRLNCTLLARWDEGYRDPWLLLTDLASSAGEAISRSAQRARGRAPCSTVRHAPTRSAPARAVRPHVSRPTRHRYAAGSFRQGREGCRLRLRTTSHRRAQAGRRDRSRPLGRRLRSPIHQRRSDLPAYRARP